MLMDRGIELPPQDTFEDAIQRRPTGGAQVAGCAGYAAPGGGGVPRAGVAAGHGTFSRTAMQSAQTHDRRLDMPLTP
jgi:hypothetical protein